VDLKKKFTDPRNAVITGGAYRQRTNNCHPGVKYRKKEKQGKGPRRRRRW
jgi:hypothetical protein